MSAGERELRYLICELGRRLYAKNYVAATDGNLSARLHDGRYLVTPSGVSKGFLAPEHLLIADGEGRLLHGDGKVTSEFFTHLAAYEEREDVLGVIHAHPPMCTAVTLAGIDSVMAPTAKRVEAWARLAKDLDLAKLDRMTTRATLKDVPGLAELTAELAPLTRDALRALPSLYGDASVLDEARRRLPSLPGITRALDDLAFLAGEIDGAELMIDLADLGGYAYHTGVMFSAYVDGVPNAVARGGRYDKVGKAFGRARAATGFSLDLREVARISPVEARSSAILAPWRHDEALRAAVSALRDAGEVVIQALPGHEHDMDEFACDRVLVERNGVWTVESHA